MKLFQPVIWSKGTFLTPQHLQAQDRFIENELHFHIEALNFRPWGLIDLSVDEKALSTGDFDLLSASGILPDGLPFIIPETDRKPPTIQIAPYFKENIGSRDIYLAVPSYVECGLNVTPQGHPTAARYFSDVEMFKDENDPYLSEKPVQVARKRFRLLLDGDSREGNTVIRIARVKRNSGVFELDPSFVPPMLNVHGSGYLRSVARGMLEILAARSAELSGTRRQRNQSVANFSIQEVANFWLLYTINSYLLPLRHLADVDQSSGNNVHPERLFSLLLSLAGALTTFPGKIKISDLPLYDHDDLGRCFGDLDEKLRILLQTSVPSNFVTLKLKLVQPWFYATAIDDDRYLAGTRMYLGIAAEMSEPEIIDSTPQFVKVSSADNVEHLAKYKLEGVKLTHVPVPPSPIPVKTNYQYFSLEQSGAAWNAVVKARNLAAHVPGKFASPQLELIIVLPQAE